MGGSEYSDRGKESWGIKKPDKSTCMGNGTGKAGYDETEQTRYQRFISKPDFVAKRGAVLKCRVQN